MRLATILPRASLGPVAVASAPDGTWIELAGLTGRRVQGLEEALAWVMSHEKHLRERAASWKGPRYRPSEFEFLPPVVRPGAFRDFDAFEAHVKTMRAHLGLEVPATWYEAPVFHFANRLALVGHEARVCAPAHSQELDFGLALGVVIGRRGKDIPRHRAWEYVAGFTVVNDLSARDLERKALPAGHGPMKGKDFATAVGPWLVLRSDLKSQIEGDRLALAMQARVNGTLCTRGNTRDLYHSIPRLVEQASMDAEIYPGELFSTGAVGGGCPGEQNPAQAPAWLKPGDRVELEIEGIGVLSTPIVARGQA